MILPHLQSVNLVQSFSVGFSLDRKVVRVLPKFRILSQDSGLLNLIITEPKSTEQNNSNDKVSGSVS